MQLAQFNIAEGGVDMNSPHMLPFTGRIDDINALADRADGFIWRLTDIFALPFSADGKPMTPNFPKKDSA